MQASHPLAGVGHPSHLGAAAGPQGGYPGAPGPAGVYGAAQFHQPVPVHSHSPNSPDSGSHGVSPNQSSGAPRKKAARKATQLSTDDTELDADGQPLKKKAKQSLSCGECKRRKIKCDRKIPCSACLKRGEANSCNWEDAKIEPEKQPFALVADVEEMRERLSLIERFINKLPQPLKTAFAELGITHMGQVPNKDLKQEDVGDFGAFSAYEGSSSVNKGVIQEQAADSLGVIDNLIFGTIASTSTTTAEQTGTPDLTPMLTTIVAPRVIYVTPATPTNLGLDPCFSQAELDAEYKRTMEKIYTHLPDKRRSRQMVEQYFEQFDWFFTILHHKTFWAENDRFWEMVEGGRKLEVDPTWLAIYFLILALSCDESMHIANPGTPDESGVWEEESAKFHAFAVRVTVFFACWTLISAHGGEFGRFSSWLACAIRAAQKMGLHQLTDDPENMPPDDPAWPPGKNALKRESALRLWGYLTFFDHLAASARFKAYTIHPSHTTTPALSNVNSADLSPTDWHITPNPRSVLTDASLEYHKLQMARISRKTFDLLIAGSEGFNYGTILELDKDYRDMLESLPDVWQQEYSSLEHKDPIIRNKRYLAMQGAHNRLVRLHRPFLVKGWEPNSRFAYSTEACIRSAKIVIISHHNNLEVNRNLRMMYSHSLTAAIVLSADLYHSIDIGATDVEIDSKDELLALSVELFSEKLQHKVASRHLRTILAAGRRVLSGLCSEQARRRARRKARIAAGQDPLAGEKSFAEILLALAREVDPSCSGEPLGPLVSCCGESTANIPMSTAAPTAQAAPPTPAGGSNINLAAWNPGPLPAGGPITNHEQGGTFDLNLLQDMGLINMGGQTWDYWSQGASGGPQQQQQAAAAAATASTDFTGFDTQALDLSAFLGGGGTATNHQDAAQALLNQLTGGW
ncbi:hypothetical protein Rhopal_002145-T1 [Rhodotorula paludigena]|uniref:Zn(2)-C6 fungal-type domain-containing protein n=1 Tax=Rhodotorula paludigena TaxID=86838 RepID=A0AAV5GI66_9BASI|nr:hypothetical protein Rhopal_002145-T1 [Rhodotorula paludigena]